MVKDEGISYYLGTGWPVENGLPHDFEDNEILRISYFIAPEG
jgi:hypothetical protein